MESWTNQILRIEQEDDFVHLGARRDTKKDECSVTREQNVVLQNAIRNYEWKTLRLLLAPGSYVRARNLVRHKWVWRDAAGIWEESFAKNMWTHAKSKWSAWKIGETRN